MHNADKQRNSFNQLVANGVYSRKSAHAEPAKKFVTHVVGSELANFPAGKTLYWLDAGCGPGTWSAFLLDFFSNNGIRQRLVAFDISEGMIDVARERLADKVNSSDIVVGDLLNPNSYLNPSIDGFDLVFAYDAVQQLPVKQQRDSVNLIAGSLAPGGKAIIFDHDRDSPYGRRMAWRKFLTRYLFIPLVPRYYCNAKYPSLAKFSAEFDARPAYSSRILTTEEFPKQALVIERSA